MFTEKAICSSSLQQLCWLYLCYSKKQRHLSSDFEKFLSEVERILKQKPNEVMNALDNLLPDLFKLRLEFLKDLDASTDITKLAEDMSETFGQLQISDKYYFRDHVLFAFRTLQRVQTTLFLHLDSEAIQQELEEYRERPLNYYTLISELSSDEQDSLDAALKTELIIIIALHISEENLLVSDQVVKVLSEQVVEAAQEFYALSKLIFEEAAKPESTAEQVSASVLFPRNLLKEEKQLADLDLLSSFEIKT